MSLFLQKFEQLPTALQHKLIRPRKKRGKHNANTSYARGLLSDDSKKSRIAELKKQIEHLNKQPLTNEVRDKLIKLGIEYEELKDGKSEIKENLEKGKGELKEFDNNSTSSSRTITRPSTPNKLVDTVLNENEQVVVMEEKYNEGEATTETEEFK